MTKKVDFDNYAESYHQKMSDQHKMFGDVCYYSEHKVKIVAKFSNSIKGNVLEFGCGIGNNLPELKKLFASNALFGSDISDKSLEVASNRVDGVEFVADHDLEALGLKFDLIFIAGVFHHIEPALRKGVISRLKTLLSDKGYIVVFDHNPYNPITRHMVSTCEFDEDAVLLTRNEINGLFLEAGFQVYESKYTLFFPERLSFMSGIEKTIGWLPLGGQYYSVYRLK